MKLKMCAAATAPSCQGLSLLWSWSLSQVLGGRVSVRGSEKLQLQLLSQLLLPPGCVLCVPVCVCVCACVSWMYRVTSVSVGGALCSGGGD